MADKDAHLVWNQQSETTNVSARPSGLDLKSERWQKFYAEHREFQPIFDHIVANTRYWTLDEVLDAALKQVELWRERRALQGASQPDPVVVLLPRGRVGSEHMIYLHVRSALPVHTVCCSESQ